jgi:EpsI family protein
MTESAARTPLDDAAPPSGVGDTGVAAGAPAPMPPQPRPAGLSRRDVLMGGALLAGAGGALALTPRGRLVLLPAGKKIDAAIPQRLGPWTDMPSSGIILPNTPDSLAGRLYGEVVSRVYAAPNRLPVMLVVAYGAVQNDLLQLHRPEVCYSAQGFEISQQQRATIDMGNGVQLPARSLLARNDQRMEPIVYWTRIGDDLPTNGTEQRLAKLRQQWDGYIADGVLVRISTVSAPSAAVQAQLAEFARLMVTHLPRSIRPALVGRPLAARLP